MDAPFPSKSNRILKAISVLPTVVKDSLGVAFYSGLGHILALLAVSLLSRIITPAEYGSYRLYLALVASVAGIFDLWIYQVGVREVNKTESESQRALLVRSIVLVELVMTCFAMTGLVLLLQSSLISKLKLIKESIPIFFLVLYLFSIHLNRGIFASFQALSRFGYYNACHILTPGLFVAGILLGIFKFSYLETAKDAMMLKGMTAITAVFFMSFMLLRITTPGKLSFHTITRQCVDLIKMSRFPLLSAWIMVVNNQSDRLMLGWLGKDTAEVGYYVNAITLSMLVRHFTSAISNVIYPKVALFYAEKKYRELKKILLVYNDFLFCLIIPICCALFIFADPLVLGIFGTNFRPSVSVFSIWILFVPILVLLGPRLQLIYTADLLHHATIGLIIGGVTNILLNLWLIPKFGVIGVTLGTGISGCLTVFYISYIVSKYILHVSYFNTRNVTFLVIILFIVAGKTYSHYIVIWAISSLMMIGTGMYMMLKSMKTVIYGQN